MTDACSSGAAAGPPPSKRLRLSRNRHACSGASGSIRRTPPLESLDFHNTFDPFHNSHLEQQQPRPAAGWLLEDDKQCVGDVADSSDSHLNQPAAGEAPSTCCGESVGKDTPLCSDNIETSQSRLDARDPGPSDQGQPLDDKPAVECTVRASSERAEQAFASHASRCQLVDGGGKEEEESGKVETDGSSPEDNAWRGGGGTRGQKERRPFETEAAEIIPTHLAELNVLGYGGQTRVRVDDARVSGAAYGMPEPCSSSYRPAAENVAEGENGGSSLLREVTPVEGNPSSLELVHQIVRDLELVHSIVQQNEQDHPTAPGSSSHDFGCSSAASLEPVYHPAATGLLYHDLGTSSAAAVGPVHESLRELPVSAEEDTSPWTGEIQHAYEGFHGSQNHHSGCELNSGRTELVSEGILPSISNQPLVESPAVGALTSSGEALIAEDLVADILTRRGDFADIREVHSTNSQQMINEDQVAVDPMHTNLPSEGGVLRGLNQQMVGSRVEIIDLTEEDDISQGDVVNILARTGRIVRAIEAYSRSPDHRTTEDQVDAGVNVLNAGLQSDMQLTSRRNQQTVEITGEVLESSREVTAEDVANIYAQAGAIAQAANNWFALSESARNRAVENINVNANWASLVQENLPREPEILGGNKIIDRKRPDEAADQSVLESQEPNAPDGLSCPICMEPWTNTGEHRICSLACGHLFGKSCIKRWIKQGGRRIGKCPHCNKRAKMEDLRNIYVPQIAVSDGHGYEVAQEVKRLKHENEELKRMNSEVHLEMARLQLEMDRLRHVQAMSTGVGIPQKVEHNRFDELVNVRKRQSQSSLQTFFGRNDRRRSRRDSDEDRLDGRHSKAHLFSGGHRSSSSLACIGNRDFGENFMLQDELHLLGAKVFDMEDHSQMALVSNKASNHGSTFGLTKSLLSTECACCSSGSDSFQTDNRISLLTLSEVQHVSLPPGLGAIRDVRFSPFGVGTPGKLALIASIGKRLSLFSLESNTIVLDYPLQSAPWSCAWDSGAPNQVYAGLQNGSLLIFDLRQTSSPIASFPGSSSRPVHTLQAVQSQSRKGILSASISGAYFWDMGTSASFSEIQSPLCISDDHRERLCISLAYAPFLKTAVASFRPSPLAQTEASCSVPAPSEADNISQASGTSRRLLEPSSSSTQLTATQDNPSHCIFSSRFEDSSLLDSTDEGKGSRREWRWEAGKAMMVGHKSLSVMPRSTIIVEPVGPRASFACGDEGTNAVWLWDTNTLNVIQTLVPHQSPVLDVKYVNSGDRTFIGCISEKTFQLYRRPCTS